MHAAEHVASLGSRALREYVECLSSVIRGYSCSLCSFSPETPHSEALKVEHRTEVPVRSLPIKDASLGPFQRS